MVKSNSFMIRTIIVVSIAVPIFRVFYGSIIMTFPALLLELQQNK